MNIFSVLIEVSSLLCLQLITVFTILFYPKISVKRLGLMSSVLITIK